MNDAILSADVSVTGPHETQSIDMVSGPSLVEMYIDIRQHIDPSQWFVMMLFASFDDGATWQLRLMSARNGDAIPPMKDGQPVTEAFMQHTLAKLDVDGKTWIPDKLPICKMKGVLMTSKGTLETSCGLRWN